MTLYALDTLRPTLPESGDFYVAPTAQVIGNVVIGHQVSIWWGAVLRGDNDVMTLGEGCNVQDNCTFHVDPGFPLTLGVEVAVGHGAILHGCTIGEGSLVGMGALVMNGASVGRGCLIGARALVTEGVEIPDYSLVMGSPGKVVRTLTPEAVAKVRGGAQRYRLLQARYRAGLVAL